jgi:hypothetical protein
MHPVTSGTISIERDESVPPVRLVFEVLDAVLLRGR